MHIPTLVVELLGILAVAVLAGCTSLGRWSPVRAIWRNIARLGRRHTTSIVLVSTLTFCLGMTASALRFPQPIVHDEFSYLLAADTFAHGRLTNPPHPMWEHFETFHVLMQPTYASKYPPAQGMILASGQILWHPVVGVWLSSALAAGAVCWMLQGWVPGRWALLGSLILVFHPFIQLYWGQNYWGGQVPMFGAALVFGALPRITRSPRAGASVIMALGALVLANSRPYEGFFACLPTACIMGMWVVGQSFTGAKERRNALVRVVLPVSLAFTLGAFLMAFYNTSVTGRAAQLPYQLHQQQYPGTPLFLWENIVPIPAFRHQVFADFYDGPASADYRQQPTLGTILTRKTLILLAFGLKFVHPTWFFSLIASFWACHQFGVRFATVTMILSIAGAMPVPWLQPHYVAPLLPLLLLILTQGTRRMRLIKPVTRYFGIGLVTGFLMLWTALFAIRLATHAYDEQDSFAVERAVMMGHLNQLPGNHLVVVRYARNHNSHHEWVYNEAEIDGAKMVWAREMSPAKNAELLDYFHNRRVWLLEPDHRPPRLLEHHRTATEDAQGHETRN